jgi:hypothetical protein
MPFNAAANAQAPGGAGFARQICSGTMLIAPQGHSVAHRPQPLQ